MISIYVGSEVEDIETGSGDARRSRTDPAALHIV